MPHRIVCIDLAIILAIGPCNEVAITRSLYASNGSKSVVKWIYWGIILMIFTALNKCTEIAPETVYYNMSTYLLDMFYLDLFIH